MRPETNGTYRIINSKTDKFLEAHRYYDKDSISNEKTYLMAHDSPYTNTWVIWKN
jgi:hypothetical protein